MCSMLRSVVHTGRRPQLTVVWTKDSLLPVSRRLRKNGGQELALHILHNTFPFPKASILPIAMIFWTPKREISGWWVGGGV